MILYFINKNTINRNLSVKSVPLIYSIGLRCKEYWYYSLHSGAGCIREDRARQSG